MGILRRLFRLFTRRQQAPPPRPMTRAERRRAWRESWRG